MILQQKDLTSQGEKMQLFEKWQSATDTYKSFYKEAEHGVRSINILKAFLRSNTEIINAQCGLDKNIEKGFNYLKPRFFLEKEKELIERILK